MNSRTILFGAFDRHNFGDMLFPHVATALLREKEARFAGVAKRDLSVYGGHATEPLALWAHEFTGERIDIIHVGGEILTCDAWQAAVMVSSEEEAQRAIASYDKDADARLEWGRSLLHTERKIPYVAGKNQFSKAGACIFCGVGGVELANLAPSFRDEVLTTLKEADYLGVRDRLTMRSLAEQGIDAKLVPDPAVMADALFGDRIRRHGREGEPARVRTAFPGGYLAVQFSADFGDDVTLRVLAEQLDHVVSENGMGLVLFRAGAAPWHDDREVFRRLAPLLHRSTPWLFESLNLWDICALIAGSRGYCGSSLHGRIVATAYALPRLNIIHPRLVGMPSKQEAYARTWDEAEPAVVGVERLAAEMSKAMAENTAARQETSDRLCALYRQSANEWIRLLA